MTDLFERRLAELLEAHPLPEEIPDLGSRMCGSGSECGGGALLPLLWSWPSC
jgi:hypothetical protein